MAGKVPQDTPDDGYRVLTQPADIRQWAEARSGLPAMEDKPGGPGQPVLRILFDQEDLNSGESQYTDRQGGLDFVSWDDWIAEMKSRNLALRVAEDVPGQLDASFEFIEIED